MVSSTPSAPIDSSRGTADTTAGRIYFSTPSAQVRVPVGDFVFPPPPLLLTLYYYLGEKLTCGGKIIRRPKNYAAAQKLSGGLKILRRRNNYPGRAQVGQKFEQNPKIVAQCRKYPIPYLITLRDHSISLHITKNTILIHCRNYTLSYYIAETIPYLYTLTNPMPKLYPILMH